MIGSNKTAIKIGFAMYIFVYHKGEGLFVFFDQFFWVNIMIAKSTPKNHTINYILLFEKGKMR